MNKNTQSILLILGIVILVNVLAKQFFFRLDLTEDKQYTLSNATKNILKNLEDPVTVSAYFSDNLPPNIEKTRKDFQEMLVEYSNLSKGMLDYQFINPQTDEEKQEAAQNGLQPVMITIREKDQAQQQQVFMGAVIKMGEQEEVIPFVQPDLGMEYGLSTSIKKLSVVDKPAIGLIQGHGEPGLAELAQAYQSLSILYNIENIDLTSGEIPSRFKTIALISPQDSMPMDHFAKLDAYLAQGGRMFVALNAVDGDLQTGQGIPKTTGLESWLASKGIEVEPSFLIDASCGSVSVQQRQGFFTINTPIQFPFLPIVTTFAEHPITDGLEQVMFPFASPVRYTGDSSTAFTPIVLSSSQSGIVRTPATFDIQKNWTAADFPLSNIAIAGVLEGNIAGNMPSKMVIIGDGDFGISGQQGRGQSEDNINLLVNSIDWLSDDTGLIELRTKGVATRPIKQEYLGEEADGKRAMIKYMNFGLPILLILIYGFLRIQRQRNKRMRRMQEKYS